MERLVNIGIILLFVSIILIVIGGLSGKGDSKVAVGGFIGPIPFGFMNDKRMLIPLIVLFVVGIVLWFSFRRIG